MPELKARGYDDLVVIVDSLDKIESLERAAKVFLEGAGTLKALTCDVLFSVPIQLAYSRLRNDLASAYDDPYLLPVVPVTKRDGTPNEPGVDALREIVWRRATKVALSIPQCFDDDETLLLLILASGGHVRQFFQLLNRVLDRADNLPLTRQLVEHSLRRAAKDMTMGLKPAERDLLALVHAEKADVGEGGDSWNNLLRSRYILGYRDAAGYWYDRNPILEWVGP